MWVYTYPRRASKHQNYLLKSGPLVIQASPTRCVFQEPICISVPSGGVVRGYIQLQCFFFLKTLSTHLPISWWVVYEHTSPHSSWVFSSLGPKPVWSPVPHPPYSPCLTPSDVFVCFPGWKNSSKEIFANVEKVEKMAEALKHFKIDEFKNCSEQWKKCLDKCIASNEE